MPRNNRARGTISISAGGLQLSGNAVNQRNTAESSTSASSTSRHPILESCSNKIHPSYLSLGDSFDQTFDYKNKTSVVWKYFRIKQNIVLEGGKQVSVPFAYCLLCENFHFGYKFLNTTTDMQDHLVGAHNSLMTKEEPALVAQKHPSTPDKRRYSSDSSTNQPTIAAAMTRGEERKFASELMAPAYSQPNAVQTLLDFIVGSGLSFHPFDSGLFARFCATLRPDFKLPSRQTLVRRLLQEHKSRLVNKDLQIDVGDCFYTLTCDSSTTRANHRLMVITIHYITRQFVLKRQMVSLQVVYGMSFFYVPVSIVCLDLADNCFFLSLSLLSLDYVLPQVPKMDIRSLK